MVKTAVLVSGGGMSLQSLLDARMFGEMPGCDLAAVISTKPDAYALRRAALSGIPQYVIERAMFPSPTVFGFAVVDMLRDLDIELVVLAGYTSEVTPHMLKHYKNRIIDSYPSLLPAFTEEEIPAGKVIEKTLRTGVKITGATAYFVSEKPRSGPIIVQKAVAVREGDTIGILEKRVLEKGENIVLPRAVSLYCEGRLTIEDGLVHIEEAEISQSGDEGTK